MICIVVMKGEYRIERVQTENAFAPTSRRLCEIILPLNYFSGVARNDVETGFPQKLMFCYSRIVSFLVVVLPATFLFSKFNHNKNVMEEVFVGLHKLLNSSNTAKNICFNTHQLRKQKYWKQKFSVFSFQLVQLQIHAFA